MFVLHAEALLRKLLTRTSGCLHGRVLKASAIPRLAFQGQPRSSLAHQHAVASASSLRRPKTNAERAAFSLHVIQGAMLTRYSVYASHIYKCFLNNFNMLLIFFAAHAGTL